MVWGAGGKHNRRFAAGSILIFFYYLLVWEKEWYMLPVITVSILLWKQYLDCREIWEADHRQQKQFQEFLESFQFFYQTHQTVEAALEQLSEQYPAVRELAVYRRLAGERVREDERTADIHKRVLFLLLEFYAEYGKEEALLKGIVFIKECVEEELLFYQKRKQIFAGVFLLILGSLLSIKPIECWAKENVTELARYYAGTQGIVTEFLCLGTIFLSLRVFIWLCFEQRYGRKQLTGIVVWMTERKCIQKKLKQYICFFKRHYEWLYSLIRYVRYEGDCQSFLLKQLVRAGICAGNSLLISIRAGEGWLSFTFFAVGAGILAWLSPYLDILLCWYQLELIKEQEILYLQAVLIAAQDVEEVGTEELNTWLIKAADYYQRVFLSLSGRLEFVKEEELLRQSEGRKDIFYHMLEGIVRGRDFGWKSAFSGIEGEQLFLRKRNHQKREKRLENEGSIGRILAMLPAFVILLIWLILPFVSEGLKQLTFYAQGIQNLT